MVTERSTRMLARQQHADDGKHDQHHNKSDEYSLEQSLRPLLESLPCGVVR